MLVDLPKEWTAEAEFTERAALVAGAGRGGVGLLEGGQRESRIEIGEIGAIDPLRGGQS